MNNIFTFVHVDEKVKLKKKILSEGLNWHIKMLKGNKDLAHNMLFSYLL